MAHTDGAPMKNRVTRVLFLDNPRALLKPPLEDLRGMTEVQSLNLPQPIENTYVLHRRFDRMGRLVGDQAMARLMDSHVMVIGLGGVGSWAAESLARSGVGRLTLVDFDEVCITNTNRQLHAVQGMVGKKKAEVMAERLRRVNPQAQVEAVPLFYNQDTSEQILAFKPDYIVDAIDNISAKCHLLAICRERQIPVVTSGGSGSKIDPTRIRLVDLAQTTVDPLAAQVRKILRQKHNFPEGKKFGIACVFSDEIPREPLPLTYDKGQGFKCVCPQKENDFHSCEHRNVIHGTASFVTGTFGLVAASWVVRQIVEGE